MAEYDCKVANPLIWISLVASLLYYATQPWHPFPGSIVLKGLAVAPLALMAWRASGLSRRDGLLLGSALAFGALGDVLLDVKASWFGAGLGAFLIGHFLYIALFWGNRRKPTKLAYLETVIVLALALFASAMSLYLLPATGDLALAVAVYLGALTGMVMAAVVMQLPERWVMTGALLFLLSDTIMAVSKFKHPMLGHNLLVWPTYYAGQLLIAVGYLRAKAGRLG